MNRIAKPASLVAFRSALPAATVPSVRKASSLTTHGAGGLAKPRKEVPLPSQESTKSVVQYALFVSRPLARHATGSALSAFEAPVAPTEELRN